MTMFGQDVADKIYPRSGPGIPDRYWQAEAKSQLTFWEKIKLLWWECMNPKPLSGPDTARYPAMADKDVE